MRKIFPVFEESFEPIKIFAIAAINIVSGTMGFSDFGKIDNKGNRINVIDVTGLVFKPISFEWHLDKYNNKINYFCTGINSN